MSVKQLILFIIELPVIFKLLSIKLQLVLVLILSVVQLLLPVIEFNGKPWMGL